MSTLAGFGRISRVIASGALASCIGLAMVACARQAPTGLQEHPSFQPASGSFATQSASINWSSPIFDGIPTTRDEAQTAGQLSFSPLYPLLDAPLTGVEVTDPNSIPDGSRGIALTYTFPVGPNFPNDGRLVIQERQSGKMTPADILAMAENPPGPAANFALVSLGTAQVPALESNDGHNLGRLLFVFNGIRYDITGPSVTTEEVTVVGRLIYSLAGGT